MTAVCLMAGVMNLLQTITINITPSQGGKGILDLYFSHLSRVKWHFFPFNVVCSGWDRSVDLLMECAGQDNKIRGLYSEGERERERERE